MLDRPRPGYKTKQSVHWTVMSIHRNQIPALPDDSPHLVRRQAGACGPSGGRRNSRFPPSSRTLTSACRSAWGTAQTVPGPAEESAPVSLWTGRWLRERPLAQPAQGPGTDSIEVMPVVVLSQVFPARPSSIPDIRDFVRRCLAESPLTDQGNREVGETVFRALLDAAGPTGSIQVAFRIFPEHVEVDVLHSDTAIQSPIMPGPPVGYGHNAPAQGAAGAQKPGGL